MTVVRRNTKLIVLILVLFLFITSVSFAETMEQTSLKLTYNGIRIYLMDENDNQVPVYKEQDHIYVPLDVLMDAIGGTFVYDAENKTGEITIQGLSTDTSSNSNKLTQEVFDSAKTAYQLLNNTSDMTRRVLSDIYDAWRYGIYEGDDATWYGFISELDLTTTDVENGIKADFIYQILYSEKTPEECFNDIKLTDDFWGNCVNWVVSGYSSKGTFTTIEEKLAQAKEALKAVGDVYSDYQYYPNLKGYYAKVSSLFEFIKSPTGSFESLKTTKNDYDNSLRTYATDLSFVFDD